MHKALTALCLLLFCARAARAAEGDAPSSPSRRAMLESVLKQHDLPAMAAAIVSDAGLQWSGVAGVRKRGDATPATQRDEWHLGSDTKAMTAALIGVLIDEGKLSLDSSMEQVFPDLSPAFTPEFRAIRLRHLLAHRAGLQPDVVWRLFSAGGGLREQRIAALKSAGAGALRSKPGEKFEYSNLNYVLAAAMAERATGESWEALIASRVFQPLGMTAGFGGSGTPGKIDQPWPHSALGLPLANGPAADNPLVMAPAGGVHCSLADWAKYIANELRGMRGEQSLLKPETFKLLHAPEFGGDYAGGWIVVQRPWAGGTALSHAGSNTMNYCIAWIAPARNFAVLICTNQGGPRAEAGCDAAAVALIEDFNRQNERSPQ